MKVMTRQVLLSLAYLAMLVVVALVFDGLAFIAAFLLLSGLFILESARVVLHAWHQRSLGGEIDSAGSGSG